MVDIVNKSKNVSDRPRKDASLKVKMNWWILAFFVTLGVIVLQNFLVRHYADLAQSNKEIVFVKLYPNGKRDVEFYQRQEMQDFLPATVNMILKRFVKVRFGFYAPTIKHDYGEVGLYLSEPLFQKFIAKESQEGFNAVQKVADALANVNNQDMVTIKDLWIDHYDSIKARYTNSGQETDVIRTNIYYTKVTNDSQGRLKAQEAKILKMQWRLINKVDLEKLANKNLEFLDYNPIGLEIVDYDEIDDPAGLNIVQESSSSTDKK